MYSFIRLPANNTVDARTYVPPFPPLHLSPLHPVAFSPAGRCSSFSSISPFVPLFYSGKNGETVNRETLFIRSKACFHLLARDYPPLFEIENTTWTRASDSDFLSSLSRYRFSFFFFSFLPFYHFLPNYRAEKMELP